jgi:hypothetical protein
MGSADTPQTKTTETKPDHYNKGGETDAEQANVKAVQDIIHRQLASAPQGDNTAPAGTQQRGAELGAHLNVLGRELDALGQLGDRRSGLFRDGKGNVHDVHAVIEDADNHFQTLVVAAQNDAKGSSGVMWTEFNKTEHYGDRLDALGKQLKTEISPEDQKKLGINFDQPLTSDQVHNAVLKAGLDNGTDVNKNPVGQHLTEYLTLSEMSNVFSQMDQAKKAGQDAAAANLLPSLVNLAHADFLMKYKDGLSVKQGEDGKPFAVTAAHVVNKISEADMKALPGSEVTQEQATQMTVDLMRKHGIPDDKNPIIPLTEGQKKNDIGLLQKAADLTKDDKFDPDKTVPEWNANQKALAEMQQSLKGKQISPDDPQAKKYMDLAEENAVLQARMLARSDAYKALGEAELKAKDGDIVKAREDLRTSIQSDPRKTPDKSDPNYKPETDPALRWENYQKQIQAIEDGKVLGKHPELKDVLESTEKDPDFQKNLLGAVQGMMKHQEFVKAHPATGKPPTDQEMADEKKNLDSWYGSADLAQKALGNAGPAIDKAYNELAAKKEQDRTPDEKQQFERLQPLYAAAHQKTLAAMEMGHFSASQGHIDDAKAKLAEAGQDTSYMQDKDNKAQLDKYQEDVKQQQFDHSPWYAKWGKYIGAGVAAAAVPALAWGAGVLLAPETGGLSLAAAAAITTGVGLGAGAIGTAAGAGLEKMGGARDSFWDATKDVAPWAMTTGGLLSGAAGFVAPELAGGAAVAKVGATEATNLAGTAAKATGWMRVPGVKQIADFMGTKTIFSEAQVPTFANIAKAGAPGTWKSVAALGAAHSLRNGAMFLPGAAGIAYSSDHPLTDSASALGTAMAAGPLRLIPGGALKSVLPRGPWGLVGSTGNFALPVATSVGLDLGKNATIAPFDSRGGEAGLWDKTWLPTFADVTVQPNALPTGMIVPGLPGLLSYNTRDAAMNAAAAKAAAEKAAREQPDDDQKDK